MKELKDSQGPVEEETDRQKTETIEALIEMNELWTLKLGDLLEQYDNIIEEEYLQRLKKPSREDQARIKSIYQTNSEFKAATNDLNRLQGLLNNQKHIKVKLNASLQMLKNQQDDVDRMNKVKEVERINAELAYKIGKLEKFNNYQYQGLAETNNFSEEQAEQAKLLEEDIAAYKLKYRQGITFK